jgi:sigma-B regulation protein RsbQ
MIKDVLAPVMNVLHRNNVGIIGSGTKTLMLCPGYGCSQDVWRHIVERLKSEYKIILFDNVGAGRSDLQAYDREKYSSLQGYADDVVEILEALRGGKVSFVGHSVGATIGMLAVVKKPGLFEKLVMIGPSPRYVNDPPDYIGGFEPKEMKEILDLMDADYAKWTNIFAPLIMGKTESTELQAELVRSFCSVKPEIAKHFGRVTFLSDNRAEVPKVKIPTLIMQCSEDIIAPMEVAHYLTRHMPISTLQLLQAKGHCPHLSYPDEVAERIRAFV